MDGQEREKGGARMVKAGNPPSPPEKSASEQIDAILQQTGGWRGETLSRLRAVIRSADPGVVEEVKWKKPSNPLGVPVWSHAGILCVGDVLKNAVRLTFPKGAQMQDPQQLFNTRMDSKTVRAVDFHEAVEIDETALAGLILQAVALNAHKQAKTSP